MALDLQLLIQAGASCKLCTVLPESFLSRGKQPSFTSLQKEFRQNRTQFTSRIVKDQSGALQSPFIAILHHKSID